MPSRVILACSVLLAACSGTTSPDAGTDASYDSGAVDASRDFGPADAPPADAPDAARSTDASAGLDAALCGGCGPGQLCCDVLMGGTYRCIDPRTDPLDCGGCNIMCRPGSEYCGDGMCVAPPCTTPCTSGLCCGDSCCAHGRICCGTDAGLQCIGDITCP